MGDILCFGDSITFGARGRNGGWCGYLKKWYESLQEGNSVYNLGINGCTSSELLERFDTESKSRLRFTKPNDAYTTIIAIGANDTKYKGSVSQENALVSEEEFRNNISQLIEKARSFKQKVALLGLLPADESKSLLPSRSYSGTVLNNERLSRFNDIIKECCKNYDVPFLDLNKIMLKKDYKSLLEDGLHPTSRGYRLVFTKVRGFLKSKELLP